MKASRPQRLLSLEDVRFLDLFLSLFKPRELVTLALVNRRMDHELRGYRRRVFCIERLLSPFFSDCDRFRELQCRTGLLISGSTALQLFDRTTYPEADLDLYVDSRWATEVVLYVRDQERYQFRPTRAQKDQIPERALEAGPGVRADSSSAYGEGYASGGIAGVLNFSKGAQRLQIIASKGAPLSVVLRFHSSESLSPQSAIRCDYVVAHLPGPLAPPVDSSPLNSLRDEHRHARKSLQSLPAADFRTPGVVYVQRPPPQRL